MAYSKKAALNWNDPDVINKFLDVMRTERFLSGVAKAMGVSPVTIWRRLRKLEEILDDILKMRAQRATDKETRGQ